MKKMKIIVPDPCAASWEEMSPAEKGRFCANCKKDVIDFGSMTDKAILDFVRQNGTAFCGSFHESQLNREIIYPRQTLSIKLKQITTGILAFSLFKIASAQQTKIDTPTTQYVRQSEDNKEEKSANQASSSYIISGQVTTPYNTPEDIAGTYIMIGNDEKKYYTDSSGKFVIELDPTHLAPYTIVAFYHAKYAREVRTVAKPTFPATLLVNMTFPSTGRTGGAPIFYIND